MYFVYFYLLLPLFTNLLLIDSSSDLKDSDPVQRFDHQFKSFELIQMIFTNERICGLLTKEIICQIIDILVRF